MRKIIVTIDTNCINVKEQIPALNKLEEWHHSGLIEIVKTDVMDTEFLEGSEKFKEKSKNYREDIGVGVLNHSRANHCVVGGNDINYPLDEIKSILFPQFNGLSEESQKRAMRDAMHLATHFMYKRDFFVTLDKNFFRVKDELKEKYGIIILTPNECVEKVESLL